MSGVLGKYSRSSCSAAVCSDVSLAVYENVTLAWEAS
jgi:hypothetical protein